MIKVNLLRNVGGTQSGAGPSAQAGGSTQTEAAIKQLAIAKSVLALIPMIILVGIEKYNISILTQKLEASNEQIAKIDQEGRFFRN